MVINAQDAASARSRLLALLLEHAYRHSQENAFQLTSGKKTADYIDCKKVSLDPEGAYLIGLEIFQRIKDLGAEGVGGMTLGADPMATAVSLISFIQKKAIPAFIVRKAPKGHGSRQQIEGRLKAGAPVVVLEDVVTTGGSTLRTLEVLKEAGHPVLKVIALVDRLEGGRTRIARAGAPFESLFTLNDFIGQPLQGLSP